MTVLDELGRARYVSLTTFRKDGRSVATPVWHAVDGSELFIWTEAGSGKVKRIRNNSRVVVTACNVRGRIAEGAPSAEGTARLLDEADGERVQRLLERKYVLARLGHWLTGVLRLRRRPGIGIAVTF